MSIVVKDGNGAPQTISTIDDLVSVVATGAKQDTGNTSIGGLTETAPASDTASSGLNGRLQRVAQRITSLIALLPAALGTSGGLKTEPQAGENHLGEVGGNTAVAGGTVTRQANTAAYALGQHIAAATPAAIPCAVARKNAGTGVITGVRLSKSSASLTNASFRVHLFKTAPATLPADAATFAAGVSGVAAVALGYVDITMDQAYSDGAKGFASINAKAFDTAAGSQNIYALIEARAAYTPASAEVFTVALEALRD
ncbi:hypothetical protein [Bradyrhizobium cytisi]|uniref:Uncharacterized protein n=1 Tax=Bradyrhizobium cytisi TaxID=515489 RepID=A0A5S4WD41_9BRAD|nr:hypothetical protein [Bradyrhizobium cytisi]TYL80171.1 hypothetical protein FXB38_24705 [Bradyrhizobium cytisi]